MFYPPSEFRRSPIQVQPAVHKDPAWLLLFSCSVLSDSLWPLNFSTPGFPVHHHLLKLAQTHSIGLLMPSKHLILCHPSCSSLQYLPASGFFFFQLVDSSHQVAKVVELQHQFLHWIFRVDFPYDWLDGSPCSPRHTQESSPFSSTTVQKDHFFGTQPSLWSSSSICIWLLGKT